MALPILMGILLLVTPDTFSQAADRYFDDYYFKFNPTQGTAAGFHQYDPQLEDYSRASIDKQVELLKKFRGEFQKLDGVKLSPADAVDLRLIQDDIDARLLAFESVRMWEKNPDNYSSGVTNSIFVIMARTFAAPAARLKSVIAREKQIPAVFRAA